MDQDYFNPDQEPNYVPPQDQMYMQQPYMQQPQMQQPYMQQPYVQQMPPQMPPQQKSNDISPEDNHTANIYCVISLFCTFAIPLAAMIILPAMARIFGSGENDGTTSIFSSALSTICGLSHLAGWVLMIVTRVRFPKNKFGKVLMIVYLALLALVVIGIIVLIISCIKCLQDCPG